MEKIRKSWKELDYFLDQSIKVDNRTYDYLELFELTKYHAQVLDFYKGQKENENQRVFERNWRYVRTSYQINYSSAIPVVSAPASMAGGCFFFLR